MGLVYSLMSSGFNLVMSVPNIIFIAFGQFYMLGAFGVWYLETSAHAPYWLAVPIAVLATAVLGGLIYPVVFRRLQFKDNQFLTNIIAGVGLMLILGQAALMLFGTEARGVPSPFGGMYTIAGVRISQERGVVIILSVAVLILLNVMLQRSRIGRAMRAVSFRADVAALQGINADRVFMVAMVIGCGLAGFAGAVMAPVFGVNVTMASNGLLVLLVVQLGGIGSMAGGILGGIVLGMILSFGQFYVGSGQAQILFFAIIAVILLFRPQGLLGQGVQEMNTNV
jgi:branched-chain amino acid transport system permease protein